MPPNASSYTTPPPAPYPSTPSTNHTSRRKTAFKTAQSLKLMTRSSTSAAQVHFPSTRDDTTSPTSLESNAEEIVRTPTIPGPRSMSPPTARPRPDGVRVRPSSMYAIANSSGISFPSPDPPYQRLESIDARLQEPSPIRHQSQTLTPDLPRPRKQPLRDEVSGSPRRVTHSEEQTPRRPARRSFGSAGILEAEIVRARDREAQAGIAISTPVPSRSGIQVVGRTAYAGVGDGQGVLEVRIVILGDEKSGKTALARRYTEHAFYPASLTNSSSSLSIGHSAGANSTAKGGLNGGTQLYTTKARAERDDGLDVKMQIWVVKERHRSLTKLYYRGAHAALILYDISSVASFMEVQAWLQELQGLDTLIYVIGTKTDLAKEGLRKIERRYAREQVYRWLSPETADQETEVIDSTASGPPRSAPASTLYPREVGNRYPSLTRSQTIDMLSTAANAPVAETSRPRPYRFLSLLPGSNSMQLTDVAHLLPSQAVSNIDSDVKIRPRRADSMSATNALKRVSMLDTENMATTVSSPRLETNETPQSAIAPRIKAARRKSEDWSLMGNAVKSQSSTGYIAFEDPSGRAQSRKSAEILSRNSSLGGNHEAAESSASRGEEEIWGRCQRVGGLEVRIGELSAKANRGVNELFQSITYQLALRKRRIGMAEVRRARESVQLTAGDGGKANVDSARGDGKFFGGRNNCCSV